MNKKIITGAVIALAAGLAAYVYSRKKNKVSTAADDAYNTMSDAIHGVENKTENIFS